jgi:gluconate kinase
MTNIHDEHTIRWVCPHCREIPIEQVIVYNQQLRVQQFELYPILPTCRVCGSEVSFTGRPTGLEGQKLLVLSGTCASGKTTTACALRAKYGFDVIDGDCVMNVIRHKTGVHKVDFNGPAMLAEIALEIDILLALKRDIVLSHVIVPEDIPLYRRIFQSRQLRYKLFVLQPSYQAAVARSQTRTCFNHITPEVWVKHFYDLLSTMPSQAAQDVVMFDNTALDVEQSTAAILKIYTG